MATPNKTPLWKKLLGYTAFALFAFVVSLYLTFPYEIIKQQVITAAKAQGYHVAMSSFGPGLFGITASGVKLSKSVDVLPPAPEGGESKPPEPLLIDSVSLRPSLFPLGVAVRAKLMDGTVAVAVGGLKDVQVRAQLSDLDLSKGNLKGFSGMDLSGEVNGDVSLDIPKVVNPATKGQEPDLSATNGNINLAVKELNVNGGTVTVPMYGQPTPLDLPKIAVGNIDGKILIEKGLATIENLRSKSSDLELIVGGTVKLAKKMDYSELGVSLKVKAEQEFVKRLGMIGMAFSMMQADKSDPTFRSACITGYLGKPNQPAPCKQ